MVSKTCPLVTKSPSLKLTSRTSPATCARIEIVEIASTLPTVVTSTGIVFWLTLPTLTDVGGAAGGAACSFVQPEVIAAIANKAVGARFRHGECTQGGEFQRCDLVIITITCPTEVDFS